MEPDEAPDEAADEAAAEPEADPDKNSPADSAELSLALTWVIRVTWSDLVLVLAVYVAVKASKASVVD